MASTSLLVPVAGIVTSPILAHAVGVAGRGEIAAAISPNALLVTVATLGLPEALTFILAKVPRVTRRALSIAAAIAIVFGIVCVAAIWPLLPFLSGGSSSLAFLIGLAAVLAIPQLGINLLRGAASGRQMWRTVAWEKTIQSVIRVGSLIVLAISGHLTVLNAVLVICLGPLIAGLVYWRLLLRAPLRGPDFEGRLAPSLLGFGSKVWLGAVSSMLVGRLGQTLFAPLSTVAELGLFVVAVSISEVPLIFAIAIRDVLFSVNSRENDSDQLTASSRLTLLVGVVTCLVLGGTLPLWIDVVFGKGFSPAVLPTWILMASTLLSIPGFMAGAGLSAWGRPGLRSASLLLSLVTNIPLFVWLVPSLGAVGGAIAALCGSLVAVVFSTNAASRVMGVRASSLFLLRKSDLAFVMKEAMLILRRVRPSRRG